MVDIAEANRARDRIIVYVLSVNGKKNVRSKQLCSSDRVGIKPLRNF